MSTRSFGMVGKTYKTAQEAFKDASYASAIEKPLQSEYSPFWALLGVLLALGAVAYVGFTRF
jgi:type VI protein secretion system component VasF